MWSGSRLRVVERRLEAESLQRRLRDAADLRRRLDAERVEHGRDHVDRVGVLRADLALGLDALRPGDDEGIGGAAAIGFALPAAERRVAGVGPAPCVVVEIFRAAEVVDGREVLLEIVGHVVEELAFVDRAGRPALGARAVVGDDHDQGVVVLADVLQERDQLADVVVGVLEKAGEHLHHPRIEAPLVGGELAPVLHVGIVARELRGQRG